MKNLTESGYFSWMSSLQSGVGIIKDNGIELYQDLSGNLYTRTGETYSSLSKRTLDGLITGKYFGYLDGAGFKISQGDQIVAHSISGAIVDVDESISTLSTAMIVAGEKTYIALITRKKDSDLMSLKLCRISYKYDSKDNLVATQISKAYAELGTRINNSNPTMLRTYFHKNKHYIVVRDGYLDGTFFEYCFDDIDESVVRIPHKIVNGEKTVGVFRTEEFEFLYGITSACIYKMKGEEVVTISGKADILTNTSYFKEEDCLYGRDWKDVSYTYRIDFKNKAWFRTTYYPDNIIGNCYEKGLVKVHCNRERVDINRIGKKIDGAVKPVSTSAIDVSKGYIDVIGAKERHRALNSYTAVQGHYREAVPSRGEILKTTYEDLYFEGPVKIDLDILVDSYVDFWCPNGRLEARVNGKYMATSGSTGSAYFENYLKKGDHFELTASGGSYFRNKGIFTGYEFDLDLSRSCFVPVKYVVERDGVITVNRQLMKAFNGEKTTIGEISMDGILLSSALYPVRVFKGDEITVVYKRQIGRSRLGLESELFNLYEIDPIEAKVIEEQAAPCLSVKISYDKLNVLEGDRKAIDFIRRETIIEDYNKRDDEVYTPKFASSSKISSIAAYSGGVRSKFKATYEGKTTDITILKGFKSVYVEPAVASIVGSLSNNADCQQFSSETGHYYMLDETKENKITTNNVINISAYREEAIDSVTITGVIKGKVDPTISTYYILLDKERIRGSIEVTKEYSVDGVNYIDAINGIPASIIEDGTMIRLILKKIGIAEISFKDVILSRSPVKDVGVDICRMTVSNKMPFPIESVKAIDELFIKDDFEKSTSPLKWTSNYSNNGFTRSTKYKKSGTYSGFMGTKNNSANFYSQTTVKAKKVSFWYLVSSEANYDFFRFYIDGVEKLKASGTTMTSMQYVEFELNPSKDTILKFEYKTDSSGSKGDGGYYIDDLELTRRSDIVDITSYPIDMKLLTDGKIYIEEANKGLKGTTTKDYYYSNDKWNEFTVIDKSEIPSLTRFKRTVGKGGSKDLMIKSFSIPRTSVVIDTNRGTTTTSTNSTDTRRGIKANGIIILDTIKRNAGNNNSLLDMVRKLAINEYVSRDMTRRTSIDKNSLLDTNRNISSDKYYILDTSRTASINGSLIADTRRSLLIKELLKLNTKKESIREEANKYDLVRVVINREGTLITTDLTRRIQKNIESSFDMHRPLLNNSNSIYDSKKITVVGELLGADTKREKTIIIKSGYDLKRSISSVDMTVLAIDVFRKIQKNTEGNFDLRRGIKGSYNSLLDMNRKCVVNTETTTDTKRRTERVFKVIIGLDTNISIINSSLLKANTSRRTILNRRGLLDTKIRISNSALVMSDTDRYKVLKLNIGIDTRKVARKTVDTKIDTFKKLITISINIVDTLRVRGHREVILLDTERELLPLLRLRASVDTMRFVKGNISSTPPYLTIELLDNNGFLEIKNQYYSNKLEVYIEADDFTIKVFE